MKKLVSLILLIGLSYGVHAQDEIMGKWKTIDDETGKERSIVEIYKKGDQAYGKITKLFRQPNEELDPNCEACPGDRKNKKLIGLEIIRDMEFDQGDQEWKNGTIMDPENGEIYDCKIWREGEELKVRGYVAFFYRTQTWKKLD